MYEKATLSDFTVIEFLYSTNEKTLETKPNYEIVSFCPLALVQ